MQIPLVGPSYNLENRKASVQRSVNLFLAGMETQSKAQFILQSAPGLVLKSTAGHVTRGVINAGGRLFGVFGTTLYEIASDGTLTSRGTLSPSTGEVSMEYGLTQLVTVDGDNGYTLTLTTNTFAQITDPDFPGADTVSYLNAYFYFSRGTGQQFTQTAIDDASDIDALDFASSESRPDKLVTHLTSNNEFIALGEITTERWFPNPGGEFSLARDSAANSEMGCIARSSAKRIDNSFFWIGRDKNGIGYVLRDIDRQPKRISTVRVEEVLQSSTDLTAAVAYTYQQGGRAFYCINAPGLTSTWCYEVSSGTWHERCDLDGDGQFKALRVTHAAYCYGKQWAFDADGKVYWMDPTVNTYAGDTLKRTRISPNDVTAMRDRQFFSEFALDCNTGEAPQATSPVVSLSWSDDGGFTWSNPVTRSAGAVGEYKPRVLWSRLGSARDRVWRIDFSDDAPFNIINAETR